jgi:Protein of unknown function (DUF3761)
MMSPMRWVRRSAALAAICAAAAIGAGGAGAHAHTVAPDCKAGYYLNVSHHCVRRPTHVATAPAGATAKCRDGSYSFSEHASGTCSHHGGVAVWIHHP